VKIPLIAATSDATTSSDRVHFKEDIAN